MDVPPVSAILSIDEYKDLAQKKPKRNKYGNKKVEYNGMKFDSKKECYRYLVLIQMQQFGEIRDLKLQPEFKIIINNAHVCTYKADFSYFNVKEGKTVVEDTKGYKTAIYKLKKKLMKAVYNIEILES